MRSEPLPCYLRELLIVLFTKWLFLTPGKNLPLVNHDNFFVSEAEISFGKLGKKLSRSSKKVTFSAVKSVEENFWTNYIIIAIDVQLLGLT
jgi:hypothetical protein